MTTLNDLIQETHRRLEPVERTPTVALSSGVSAGAVSLPFTDTSINSNNSNSITPGKIIACDLELFLVTGVVANGAIPVQAGYRGSPQQAHLISALVYIAPRYSDFDIFTAINHDLDSLSSPANGLYNISQIQVGPYNAVFQSYDLTDYNTSTAISGLIDIIAVRFKTPLPDQRRRAIAQTNWELVPSSDDPTFPSGYALNILAGGWPGQPIMVTYKKTFSHFTTSATPATDYAQIVSSVTSLPVTATDLPPLGAMLQMIPPREIARNTLGAQPDSRIATEVPPGAVMNSASGVMRERQMRISEEASRLKAITSRYRTRF